MLEQYRKKTNIGIGIGLAMQIMANVLLDRADQISIIAGIVFALAGTVVFIWGCISYARGKGYHPALGLLGLMYLLGLLILVLLRDKHKQEKK